MATRGNIMKLKRQKGVAAVEFGIVMPFLLLIALGMIQFGWLLINYVMVSDAASSGAIYFASQRGATNPYSATQTQVFSSSTRLTAANLSIATSVNGTTCATDAACATALSNAMPSASSVSTATVTITYTFTPLIGGSLFGLAAMMPSSLVNSVAERVQ
jgi:Flp pilus assembly protein TadG